MKDVSAWVDVSVVLNCHRENTYLKTSIDSIRCAVVEARKRGISSELIVILDNPSNEVREIVNNYNFPLVSFEVSFGSLGLSRNYGIKKAHGKYILTADADDLISSNMVYAMYSAAENYHQQNKKDCCLIPQFYYSFGKLKTLCEYYSSKYFSPSDIVTYHPFVSRIFTTLEILKKFPYNDLNKNSGFAFEDWDLNSSLYVNGIEIIPVKDTVVFYRRREGSIMSSNDYVKFAPLSSLVQPKIFLQLSDDYRRPEDFKASLSTNVISKFSQSPELSAFLLDANKLDPSIDVNLSLSTFSSVGKNLDCIFSHWGYRLRLILRLIGTDLYDDVFLLPWLEPGGGEKFILQVLDQISNISPKRRILVLSVEKTNGGNVWKQKLPKNALFLNLFSFIYDLSHQDCLSLVTRLLLSIGKELCHLHIKSSTFLDDLLATYGITLSKKYLIYKYLFCIPLTKIDGRLYFSTENIERIRNEANIVHRFITDNKKIAKRFTSLLGKPYEAKFSTIYAYVNVENRIKVKKEWPIKFLWASRVCSQKRIELLNEIASLLETQNEEITIEVYGHRESSSGLKLSNKLVYKGDFLNFSEIKVSDYRGLIYTSNFDGIPNVVLEAMSMGLPVIASVSDFSALDEVLSQQTGWLVSNSLDDKVCAANYVQACHDLLSSSAEVTKRVKNAINVLLTQHSKSAQRIGVLNVFQIDETIDTSGTDKQWDLLRGQMILFLESLKQPIDYFSLVKFVQKEPIPLNQLEFARKYNQLDRYIKNKTSFVYRVSMVLEDFPKIYHWAKKIYRLRFLLKSMAWLKINIR